MNLKTNFFKKTDYSAQDAFVKDIKGVEDLKSEALKKIPELYLNLLKVDSTTNDQLIDDFTRKYNLKEFQTRKALTISRHFLDNLGPNTNGENDAPEDLVHDIIELELVSQDSKEKFLIYFKNLNEFAFGEYYSIVNKERYEASSLPLISSISSTVNLRAVLKDKLGVDDDIETYEPKIIEMIPVTTIQLKFTEDSPNQHVYFQSNRKALKKLIKLLQGIDKELESLEKFAK